MRLRLIALMAFAGFAVVNAAQSGIYLHAPSVDTYARHDPAGLTILSNGRYLKPVGTHLPAASFLHGLAVSRDGAILFVASRGTGKIIRSWQSGNPQTFELRPPESGKRRSTGGGADFSPDGRMLYWSGGDSGSILIFDLEKQQAIGEISLNVELNGKKFEDSYAADVKMSDDGRYLYCADVTNFRVAVVDTVEHKMIGSVGVGRYPYALAVEGKKIHVANIGLFEYSPIPDPDDAKFDKRGITRPAFGYPSREARDGKEFEGRKIPGLGEANVPESFSVWTVDAVDPASPKVIHKLKTGLLIGTPSDDGKTIGGSAPNFLAVHGDSLFVSNGNNDIIERIDLRTHTIAVRQRIVPSPLVAGLRGVVPSGMVVSADGARLYVAEMGINAIAVLDAKTLAIMGHIPTAWYPYRIALLPDGRRLICVCFRGFGNGPKGKNENIKSDFLAMRGVVSMLDVPSDAELEPLSATVLANNGIANAEADRAAMSSSIIPAIAGKPSKRD